MMACGSLAALIFTTAYAPLFHVHEDTGGAPLIHAHFPELEIAENERVVHMEARHSHSQARPIDILTTTAPALRYSTSSLLPCRSRRLRSKSVAASSHWTGREPMLRPRWRTSFLAFLPPDIFPVSDA